MADHAKGIATLVLRMVDQPMLKPLIDIPRMAEIGRELLIGQLGAFVRGDVEAARAFAARIRRWISSMTRFSGSSW